MGENASPMGFVRFCLWERIPKFRVYQRWFYLQICTVPSVSETTTCSSEKQRALICQGW